ncbi:MAG: site-specific DNA-methyltransferase [Clostridia bacterium]|nr:site-specific DNA-methyltransferase [Clostridia bacterium]
MIERAYDVQRELSRAEEGSLVNEFHLGDAAAIAKALKEQYAGKVSLIYLDPPFQTGKRFEVRARVGESEWKTGRGSLVLEGYNDDLPRNEYLEMMKNVLVNAKALMKSDGLIFVHIDYRIHPYLRILMDEIFGESNFINEIIWSYHTGGCARKHFPRKHDVILLYSKTKNYDLHLEDIAEPNPEGRANHMKKHVDADGRVYRSIRSGGRTYTYYDDDPVIPGDVWNDMSHLQQKDPQRTGYDTQKPLRLLERIVKCASRPGDIVMDLFAGSGTTLEAAAVNGRRFIGCDLNPLSMQTAHRRLDRAECLYHFEPFSGEPEIRARAERGVAFTRVELTKFEIEPGVSDRRFEGLDGVDSWAVGYQKNGLFHSFEREVRSHAKPRLTGKIEIPVFEGELMMRVTDVFGRYFFYHISVDENV